MSHTKVIQSFNLFTFLLLLAVWLLLTNSFTPGNILLAILLAWFIPKLVGELNTEKAQIKKPMRAVKYVLVMLWDILVSNLVVARQVLGPLHLLRPGFITIPLDIKDPLPITLLSSTISLTPGTVSTEISKDRKTLYVHALHVEDESEMVAHIKQRYEAPLKEIFGC
ncbi:MAG: Na+/H+ antiporter subunit E [Reinekea sp.]|jgi:multicomponent K+:H+ antiporter subunit E